VTGSKPKKAAQPQPRFGTALGVQQLAALTGELKFLREHPPLVKRSDGKYEGDILGFVRGLRLSAGVIYFLRERLSSEDVEVSWGHMLDEKQNSCSPECDVIVHSKGHVRKWNGNEKRVMEFTFVQAEQVRAVISCKSRLTAIDKVYPKDLKGFGVKNIFLFAESCEETKLSSLRKTAKKAGYRGLWCLYQTQNPTVFKTDDNMLIAFGDAVHRAIRN
jgi:hypothetical protein